MKKIYIEGIIYVYVVLCLGLVLFNILYLFKERWGVRQSRRCILFWQKTIYEQYRKLQIEQLQDPQHEKRLMKKLVVVSELSAFEKAYRALITQYPTEDFSYYISSYMKCFRILGEQYSKKKHMEKAYFAYFVATCFPREGKGYGMMSEILVPYLVGSTVYCRENVLRALYRLGDIQGVDNAFRVLNDYRYFHHPKLLADGLMTFSGDQKRLAQTLWKHHEEWSHEIMVAIIQFIMAQDDSFVQCFYTLVDDTRCHMEMRLAIIRYYKKYHFAPVAPILQGYLLSDEGDENLSIVAAATLENYESTETRRVLKQALNHRSWYVRRNAARSLIALGITHAEREAIIYGSDRYASEMLQYMMRKVS